MRAVKGADAQVDYPACLRIPVITEAGNRPVKRTQIAERQPHSL